MRSWQDYVNVVVGAWLFFSPWILGFAGMQLALWNALIFGAVIFVLAVSALSAFQDWEEWVDMAVGLWLIISPWVLGVAATTAVVWNFVIVGVLALILSGWALREHHDAHAA
jgi:hypothetical protein